MPLIALRSGLIVAFHVGVALAGRPFLRAVHLGTALEYAHGSINLLRPVVVGFNATGTPTAQELPVWQAAAALALKITRSNWYGWANIVSDLGRLKALDYNKLVLVSESPVEFAAKAVDPGYNQTRYLYPDTISPKVDAWPVVYRSEDILIRDIPAAPQ